jgi:hypothetical protein
MSFEDELKELIQNAKSRAERSSKESLDFSNGWQSKKLNVVQPVLDRTAKVLADYPEFDAGFRLHNGSISLKIVRGNNPAQMVANELTFSAIEADREVSCHYRNPHAVMESFTLDSLDTTAVERKVKEFLAVALA